LKETIKYGIAYHHSGLTGEQREVIERGYRTGALLVLVATSTLSTGINLPAKVVFFKSPMIANQLIDAAKYKQMSERAGRTGFDSKGDSIMICNAQQKDYVLVSYFKSSPQRFFLELILLTVNGLSIGLDEALQV
jgi:DNA polymerase theta